MNCLPCAKLVPLADIALMDRARNSKTTVYVVHTVWKLQLTVFFLINWETNMIHAYMMGEHMLYNNTVCHTILIYKCR